MKMQFIKHKYLYRITLTGLAILVSCLSIIGIEKYDNFTGGLIPMVFFPHFILGEHLIGLVEIDVRLGNSKFLLMVLVMIFPYILMGYYMDKKRYKAVIALCICISLFWCAVLAFLSNVHS